MPILTQIREHRRIEGILTVEPIQYTQIKTKAMVRKRTGLLYEESSNCSPLDVNTAIV